MIKRESKKRRLDLQWLAAVVLAVIFVGSALAQEEPPLDEELLMPGTIEGTGTYFEVTDSEYLNIVFQSSEPVHLTLESVPQMVVMHIEAAEGASSTWITLTGFAPSTTYYKYQDDYHNEVAFTTDGSGSYTYTQDLAIPHLVFIQPLPGTMYIPPHSKDPQWWKDWWDGTTLTLQANVSGTIQIDADGVTLDGAGYSVTGPGWGSGVYLNGRTGVTIQNLNVQGFSTGIYLYYSSGNTLTGNNVSSNHKAGITLNFSTWNTLTGNTASDNSLGIYLISFSNNNTLTGNIANSNNRNGIYLYYFSNNNTLTDNTANLNYSSGILLYFNSSGNTLTGNTASNNYYGIYLYMSSDNTLTDNTASDNNYGIALKETSDNTLTGNTTNSNMNHGIYLESSRRNTLTGNTANSNNDKGIWLEYSNNNTLTDNTATANNIYGIILDGSSNNTLAGNTASNNSVGMNLSQSSNNTLTGNTANSNNEYGIWLSRNASDNQIYNNNFIDNATQALDDGGSGNVFNLAAPTGGNYWSDYTGVDTNGDGMGETPYTFTGGQDNLPWVRENGWILTSQEAIEQLIDDVAALNLQKGIDNSLDAKLDAAFKALDDVNENNDVAAINALQAFINAVEAQRGKKISDENADALIATVNNIIAMLSSP